MELLIALVALVALYWFIGRQVYARVSVESFFRSRYGAEWKQHYTEDMHITVEENHKKILVGGAGMVAVCVLGGLFYRQLVPKRRSRKRHRRSRRSQPIVS